MIIPPAPPRSPSRLNLVAAGLALITVVTMIPVSLKFIKSPIVVPEKSAWRMPDVLGETQDALITRFGAPMSTKDYSLHDGSFAGRSVGEKHYYAQTVRGYAKLLQDAPVTWTFPQYLTIREIIWKLPDSYLTVWLHEPRAEVSLGPDTMEMTLPSSAPGAWVALDDYRIGKDLVAH